MSKPALRVAVIGVIAIVAILAGFVLRKRPDGGEAAPAANAAAPEAAEPPPRPEPVAAPTSPAVARVAAPPRRPAIRDAGVRLDVAAIVSRLHELAASDPPRSLELAREALARFPDSPSAPELEWNAVKALANMDRYEEAEEEARSMLRRFPGNAFTEDVEHHLLNHPPNPPSAPPAP